MSNEDIQSLQKLVNEQIQENIGMSMIYTIVSAAQEWMQDKVGFSQESIAVHIQVQHAASEADSNMSVLTSTCILQADIMQQSHSNPQYFTTDQACNPCITTQTARSLQCASLHALLSGHALQAYITTGTSCAGGTGF